MTMEKETPYRAYLLRLWRPGTGIPWRASLQRPMADERVVFGDLDGLFAYLRVETVRADYAAADLLGATCQSEREAKNERQDDVKDS